MLLGKKLSFGDTIGIIAPASCDDFDIIEKKIKDFKNLGFKVKIGDHLYDKKGYFAGDDRQRAADLMNMFKDDTVTAIICFRGGYGTMRILPYLDLNIIKKNPKIVCGYSDITILLNYLYKQLGFITFHGPMIKSNFEEENTRESFISALIKGNKGYKIDLNGYSQIEMLNPNNIKGVLVGGNLSLICSSLGTPFEIETKNKILIIEEVNEKIYAIDRMLTQLLMANKLQCCKGFILGYFTPNKEDKTIDNFTITEVIKDRILTLNKPTILNFPFGHEYPNLTIPIGIEVTFDFTNKKINIPHPVVR
ncbi:peptidase S66 [Clostridium polyendosporum]|uniref:Peptidase S66 n=1 Tax=Clostridium polyendosporum TaxID=69208 RepID=A0A919S224_9CLOT|nr:LD-carboxypeptidase [Clostridium polyendosporum]GIM30019.1 peptidase S66 [Clostridium polyendosporum]